jgi:hypothetical protein
MSNLANYGFVIIRGPDQTVLVKSCWGCGRHFLNLTCSEVPGANRYKKREPIGSSSKVSNMRSKANFSADKLQN